MVGPIVHAWNIYFLKNKATNFNMFCVQELMKIELKNSILCVMSPILHLSLYPYCWPCDFTTLSTKEVESISPPLIWYLPRDLLWSTEWGKSGGVLIFSLYLKESCELHHHFWTKRCIWSTAELVTSLYKQRLSRSANSQSTSRSVSQTWSSEAFCQWWDFVANHRSAFWYKLYP